MKYLFALLCIGGVLLSAPISMIHYRFDPAQGEPEIPVTLKGTPQEYDYYIVQFTGPVLDVYKQGVMELGGEFYYYIPEYAFVVKLPSARIDEIRNLPQVSWVGYYHPAYKISPNIGKHTFKTPQRKNDPKLRLWITPFPNVDLERLLRDIQNTDAQIIEATKRIIEIRIDKERLNELARINGIFWIEEKPECFLMNNITRWVIQTNVQNDTTVWAHGLHGEGEMVGCMDSGIDILHCFHRDPEGDPPGPNHRKVKAYREYTTPAGMYDFCEPGHGTHVVGTIQGDDYTNTIPAYNGMAYKAVITFGDIQDTSWSACNLGAVYPPNDLTTDFNAAYNDGARAHTNSWGSTSNTYDAMAQQVDQAMWNHKDMLILFANGNSGPDANTVGSPATAKNCVSVGATQQAPNQNNIADFSSRGTAYDGRTKPTVCAPGVGINSADNQTSQSCSYVAFDGTSMATPATCGAALLVRQYYRLGYYPGGYQGSGSSIIPSAALMKSTLINSADKMGSLTFPGIEQGYGRVNLNNALYFAGEARKLLIEDNATGLSTGGSWSKQFQVSSSTQSLKVVLCWTDYPAAQSANPAIVNNLDLQVQDPNGNIYRGNYFSGGWSQPGGSADNINVEELVWIQTPTIGTWTVTVLGTNVPQGPQPFAVTITGDASFTGIAEGKFEVQLPRSLNVIPSVGRDNFKISYNIYRSGPVNLRIYDASGRLVYQKSEPMVKPGAYERIFSANKIASGVYFVRLDSDGLIETTKFLIVK
ncbi:MAG: S8 family serine peptidase [candidate division WOR-3 bacterium]